jgi:hypothetical protein
MHARPVLPLCLILAVCFVPRLARSETLWAYYPIHENDFNDYSGNKHHGTPVDGATTVLDLQRGWVASFNDQPEKPSRVLCGIDDPSAGGELTVSVWLWWDGTNGNWQGMAGKSFEYGQRRWIFQLRDSDGMIQWGGTDSANLHIWSDVAPAIGEWQHVVGTCDGSYSKVYINSEIAGEGAGGFADDMAISANVTLGFGEDRDDYDESLNGLLDEIYILTRAVSDAQVPDLAEGIIPSFDKARDPIPADGAIDVTLPLLRWTAGDGATMHEVYLGTDPNLGPDDLVQPRSPSPMYYHGLGLTPGQTYYWRVDEIEADMTTIHTGDVWMFMAQPLTAYLPDPADGANDASTDPNMTVTWLAGTGAFSHHVYFGESFADVNEGAGGTDLGTVEEPGFAPGPLAPLTTYYWRVDEVALDGSVQAGAVWSFTTYKSVDDFESYTNEVGERVFEVWIDGFGFSQPPPGNPGNGSNAAVGHDVWDPDSPHYNGSIIETKIVRGGGQSMPVGYSNGDAPHYSEAERLWSAAQNWAANGANTVVLYVRGLPTNAPEPLYARITDSTGRSAVMAAPDAEVVTSTEWVEWKVPFAVLTDAGVNIAAVARMVIGLGDRDAPTPGGGGTIYVDDVRLVISAVME